jgi:hypothetical protein
MAQIRTLPSTNRCGGPATVGELPGTALGRTADGPHATGRLAALGAEGSDAEFPVGTAGSSRRNYRPTGRQLGAWRSEPSGSKPENSSRRWYTTERFSSCPGREPGGELRRRATQGGSACSESRLRYGGVWVVGPLLLFGPCVFGKHSGSGFPPPSRCAPFDRTGSCDRAKPA